jgi:hypothetical protein
LQIKEFHHAKISGWQTLDFGVFKLKTPLGWTIINEKGIDSYVGGLTNGKDRLSFDYGFYSADIGDEDPKTHKFGEDTINGLIARIVIPITQGDGYIRMYIPVNSENKFSISGHNIHSTDTILKIFKSIVFKESDTLKNSSLTMDKFKYYPNGTGKTLFQERCASCHSLRKDIAGPALQNIMEEKTSDRLYKFVTHRKLVANDTQYLNLRKAFNNLNCTEFPSLTKEDVGQIAIYIRTN